MAADAKLCKAQLSSRYMDLWSYQRGAMLEKRRKLMEAWGAYCDGGGGKVIPTKQ